MACSLLHKNFSQSKKCLDRLIFLADRLKCAPTTADKLEILNEDILVKQFLNKPCAFVSCEYELVYKSVIAAGQHSIFSSCEAIENDKEHLQTLLEQLLAVERFYMEMGGIVGYQMMMLQFLLTSEENSVSKDVYLKPEGIDIAKENDNVRQAIVDGINHLPILAEFYPLGGAADRLRLFDKKTKEPLPAARLLFGGRTLLEGLIRDVQAREYVYYKLFDIQHTTPIAMMTSQEKKDHDQVLAICAENNWFGRPKESFRFFCQPSVPTVDAEGNWCLTGPLKLLLKPGGHGAIWKLARDEGIFDWLASQGRKKALVRQINNPIAGTDYGIFAFTGIGCRQDKKFGFASCPRVVSAKEGTNVLIERKNGSQYEYILTNIEYSDFKRFNLPDEPAQKGSSYSKYSSNTNLLFIDLQAVSDAVSRLPYPGKIINFKKASYRVDNGKEAENVIARLETMMQNIADLFTEKHPEPLSEGKRGDLNTFITYHERRKTISTTKQEYISGASLLETPEGCFLDHLENMHELLEKNCGMQIPTLSSSFQDPSLVMFYHPSLGPFYSIIGQKIQGGRLSAGSELQLEIADLYMENLELEGSLLIQASDVMGHQEDTLVFSDRTGKCFLRNVKVRNAGIKKGAPNIFWKNEIVRTESCSIILEGNAEFYAENISLNGNVLITVKNGMRVTATEKQGKLVLTEEKLQESLFQWKYSIENNQLQCAVEFSKNIAPKESYSERNIEI